MRSEKLMYMPPLDHVGLSCDVVCNVGEISIELIPPSAAAGGLAHLKECTTCAVEVVDIVVAAPAAASPHCRQGLTLACVVAAVVIVRCGSLAKLGIQVGLWLVLLEAFWPIFLHLLSLNQVSKLSH